MLIQHGNHRLGPSLALRCSECSPLSKGACVPSAGNRNINTSENPDEKCVKSCGDHRAWGVGNTLELMEHGGDLVTGSLLELAKPAWIKGTEGGLA